MLINQKPAIYWGLTFLLLNKSILIKKQRQIYISYLLLSKNSKIFL